MVRTSRRDKKSEKQTDQDWQQTPVTPTLEKSSKTATGSRPAVTTRDPVSNSLICRPGFNPKL